MAFAYEDICKDIFASVCKQEEIPFVPSRIGSYWLNDYDSNTEIDIMAIDNQNKRCMFPKGREKTEVIGKAMLQWKTSASGSASVSKRKISRRRIISLRPTGWSTLSKWRTRATALFIGTAILLLVIAITGIVLTCKCLRNKQALRTVSIVLLSLITMVLAVYVVLTIFFVYAVSRQPPIS